ncbi:MAG: ABC transporter permease [Parvibaculaceae bacterium]
MNPNARPRAMLGAAPLTAVFAVFYFLPLFLLLFVSAHPAGLAGGVSLQSYADIFTDSFSLAVLADTLWLAFEATFFAGLLAIPLATYYRSAGRTARSILIMLILMPLLTSTVVRTFAWIVILGRDGVINSALVASGLIASPLPLLYSRGGLVLALAQITLPLMVLPIINSMLRIDDRLLHASQALGASRWRTFAQVILPLSVPGILAGSLLSFAYAATAFVTHTLVGGGRQIYMPLLIYQQSIGLQKWDFAAALSIIFMIAIIAIMAIVDRLVRSRMRGINE